jgi:hypothetical protein
LEDEAFTVQEPEDRRWEAKIPRGSGRIRRGDVAADVSAAAKSNQEWKKSKVKTEDLLALLNSGFLQEKEVDMWRAAEGDLYPMEKNLDEILMFMRFAE